MTKNTSSFYDGSLICLESFDPINFSVARVEVRTFIELLVEYMHLNRSGIPGGAVTMFNERYEEALATITEVEGILKDPKVFRFQVAHLNEQEAEKFKHSQLKELGTREEAIRTLIDELLKNLYDLTRKRDAMGFTEILVNTTSELKERTDHLRKLIEQAD